jgi:hypothetical protein
VVVLTVLVTAFGGRGGSAAAPALPPSGASHLLQAGPPKAQVISQLGKLNLLLPVNQARVTAIGYSSGSIGALALQPVGSQANEGLVKRLVHKLVGGGSGSPRWYQLPGGTGPSTAALDVGAPPGTDVYAPVDGTVVGLTDYVVNGKTFGVRIDIQPTSAPSLIVSVSPVRADPALSVGSSVAASSSKIGSIVDLSGVEKLGLARYTRDSGNHVSITIRPSPSQLALP